MSNTKFVKTKAKTKNSRTGLSSVSKAGSARVPALQLAGSEAEAFDENISKSENDYKTGNYKSFTSAEDLIIDLHS